MKRVLAMCVGAAIIAGCQVEPTTDETLSSLFGKVEPACDAKMPGLKQWDSQEEPPPSGPTGHMLVVDTGEGKYIAMLTESGKDAGQHSSFAPAKDDDDDDSKVKVVWARSVTLDQLADFLYMLAKHHAFDFKRPPIMPPLPGGTDYFARLAATYAPLSLEAFHEANAAVQSCGH